MPWGEVAEADLTLRQVLTEQYPTVPVFADIFEALAQTANYGSCFWRLQPQLTTNLPEQPWRPVKMFLSKKPLTLKTEEAALVGGVCG